MTERRALTLEEALAQLSALEDQINRLQAALNEVERRIGVLSIVEDALERLKEGASDAFVQLDDTGSIFVPVEVKRLEKVLVHVGLDVYVLMGLDKAVEHVREARASLSKVADTYRRELAAALQYYTALRNAVEQAIARQQARQQQ